MEDDRLTFPLFHRAPPPGYRWLSQFRSYVLPVEGNIGAGKTTLMEILVEYARAAGLTAVALEETYDATLLEAMIAALDGREGHDPDAVATFQLDMLRRRQEAYRAAVAHAATGAIVFLDRSLVGDYTFARLHYAAGRISAVKWREYMASARTTAEIVAPHAIVFPDCSVDVLLERIRRRGRAGEEQYSRVYLESVQHAYETAFADQRVPYPLLRLPWDADRLVADEGERRRIAHDFFTRLQALAHADMKSVL